MKFRTEIEIPQLGAFGYEHRFMLMGSCFAQNMGGYFQRYGFAAEVNPFGIVYNPLSIAAAMERIMTGTPFTEAELFLHNGLWHSSMHHGSFSSANACESIEKINEKLLSAHAHLQQTDVLMLTFGSSWVYEREGCIVGNCYKLPAKAFTERRVTIEEIVKRYDALIEQLLAVNPHLNIMVTVSPVRYMGQGYLASHTNKAVLLLACEALQERHACVNYFPAYELIMDELRDYRFYTADMIHPSEQAIGYVWERLTESCLSKQTL